MNSLKRPEAAQSNLPASTITPPMRGAVAAEKLGGRVDHDVRAPLDGPHQRRRSRGVVDHQRQLVLMGNGGEPLDVHHVQLGLPSVSV